ncbi:DUF397 domain-containing protein [Streptomyces longispororuber]|uniref:DUF397 domain-containing protein n=1 Tax=Streptomyces longispororuber TaxID=68230 RepID=UPI00210EF722|nr:DUF397 domain-containing protein [Streptomyces longispororuber]MCQ4207567.1 DUF397 domain-containing protein [Streptomyces longispororuber]
MNNRVDGNATWVTSSYSNDQGGECVEVRLTPVIGVRDSTRPTGGSLDLSADVWASFLTMVTSRP